MSGSSDHDICYSGKELTALPSILTNCNPESQLGEIQAVDLSCNQIDHIPSLFHLTSLETLNLSDNQITSLEGIVFPASLQTLILNGNQLTEVPLEALLTCPSLTHLSLAGNKISSLPTGLGCLTSLKHLSLGSNLLTSIPEDFFFPPNLQTLYLGGNALTALPSTLGLLSKLKVLSVHDNQLIQLPASLVRLHNLETLSLHKNRLSLLPVELLGLRKLRSLTVRMNPLVSNFAGSYRRTLPTLQELAGRSIKKNKVSYSPETLPSNLVHFLESSKECLGCGGAYFGSSCVSHVEFLDLCGSYQVPFIQYICSERCKEDDLAVRGKLPAPTTESSARAKLARLRKILLDKYSPSLSSTIEELQRELDQNEDTGDFA